MNFRCKRRLSAFMLLLLSTSGIGRMLESNELLVGTWDVHLHCPASRFHSQLFPQQVSAAITPEQQQHPWSALVRPHSFPCHLHIYSNGTFHLQPPAMTSHHPPTLHIRGWWNVHSNPYCVTDRYYDEVVLTSCTRVQKEITSSGTAIVVQKGKIRMQCRLTGHFSPARWRMGGSRRPYGKGVLTRGVVIWEDYDAQKDSSHNNQRRKPPHRSVLCASFSAKRWIPSLSTLYGDVEAKE